MTTFRYLIIESQKQQIKKIEIINSNNTIIEDSQFPITKCTLKCTVPPAVPKTLPLFHDLPLSISSITRNGQVFFLISSIPLKTIFKTKNIKSSLRSFRNSGPSKTNSIILKIKNSNILTKSWPH